ncbi:MAG: hydrogenase expression/formation protein HypE [Lachnospiraceae bacterium]|nr:hydrogenase expression/formation protein HypE [Lachnospiraceae bacterium]
MEEFVTLDYGSGGGKTAKLISEMIVPLFSNEALNELSDGAVVDGADKIVMSTDSFVVSPVFFPGGDIGKLSVCGTVNDVSMAGGEIKYLSLACILEEGFPFADVKKILDSIQRTAGEAGVMVVTGDTKVVERGRGDGIYINTTGVGVLKTPGLSVKNLRAGDKIIVSGPVGGHGTAIMLARNANLVEADVKSDCAPLKRMALALGELGKDLRVMRDPTRGGLATTLNEFIEDSECGIELKEDAIPVRPAVNTVCDMLGLDPLYLACEGRMICVTAPEAEERALEILRSFPEGEGAVTIGEVTSSHPGTLVIRTALGTGRIANKLAGDQLPRIC